MSTAGAAIAAETTWKWMAQSDWQAYDAWPSVEQRAERSRRKQVSEDLAKQRREAAGVTEEQRRAAAAVQRAWQHSDERVAAGAGAENVTLWSSVRTGSSAGSRMQLCHLWQTAGDSDRWHATQREGGGCKAARAHAVLL